MRVGQQCVVVPTGDSLDGLRVEVVEAVPDNDYYEVQSLETGTRFWCGSQNLRALTPIEVLAEANDEPRSADR